MRFEETIKKLLLEVKEEENIKEPWTLEITENLDKSEEYNLIGKLIIKLASLRSKIN